MRIPLPDPLPPAKRLDPAFAQELRRAADGANVDWALVLAVLRARDAVPARAGVVRALARRLAKLGAERDPHQAVLRLSGGSSRGSRLDSLELPSTTSFADRVVALAHYNSAVGLQGLVRGLDAVKEQLIERVLDNGRLEIYPGGRADVAGGRTDVRVLVLLLYMAQEYESVTVTSLTSGHGVYTKSGSVSAHSYGRAVDIAAINGTSIMGNQQPGGITEDALRTTMLLPPELRPKQVISLFELGGAFFAMSDHADHIHVGY